MNNIQNNPRIGFRDGIPIGIGYFAISFAFGLMAVSYGLPIYEAVLISSFNMTSAGQLAAVPIIAYGGSLIELSLAQLFINMRYALMSISLSQKFDKKIKFQDRFLLAFALTDEIFAVSIGREETLGKKYLSMIIIAPYIGWTMGTLLGAVAGNILPDIIVTALGISMYAMFIAIVIPMAKKDTAVLFVVIASAVLSCLFNYLPILKLIPGGFVIIICAVTVSIITAIIRPLPEEEESNAEHKDKEGSVTNG